MKKEELGNLVKITSGGTPKRNIPEYYNNGKILWVKTGDLKEKYITNTPEKITELGLNNSSAKLFPKNTVLIALYGATIGACSILKCEAATNWGVDYRCKLLITFHPTFESFFVYCHRKPKQKSN